jgi:CHAT domain-containing protein/Tfp pilus assembly protein PilF
MSNGWALHTTGSRQVSFLDTRTKRFAFSVASIAMCYFAVLAQNEARAQEPAPAAPIILQAGSAVQHDISGKAVDSYSIALTSGQCAQLIVEQRGIDVVVQVLDAQNKVLAEFDSDMRPQGRENVLIAPDDNGTYGVRVEPRYSRAPAGAYQIHVIEIRPATEQDRELYKAHRLATEAALLKDAAKYEDGIARAEEAVSLAEKALGPDDPYVGIVTAQLANLLWTKGDFSKAGTVAERAIRIARQDPHPNEPQTAVAMDVLALVYRVTEQGPKAEETLKELIAIQQRSLGDEHPRTVTYRAQLAWQYGHRGDFNDDILELQHAIEIADKVLEPDDFWAIALRHNLGDIYLNLDDLDHAEPLTEQALERMEKKYGPDHQNLVLPLRNLGSIARERKQYERALELFERAEKINEKTLGPQHPEAAGLLLNIGNVYKDQQHYEKAEEYFKRALSTLEVSAGPYHRLTLQALGSMQTVSAAEGKIAEAVEYSERVNQGFEKNIELNLATGSERDKLQYADSIEESKDRILSINLLQAPSDKAATNLAATVILQRKARVLDSIANSQATLREHLRPEDTKLLDDLDSTTNKLAQLTLKGPGKTPAADYSRQLASLQKQREGIEAEISKRSEGFYETSHDVTLSEVRAAIPTDSVLVEFARYVHFRPTGGDVRSELYGELRYAVYVIPHQGDAYAKDLGAAKEIDKAADALRRSLRDPERTDAKSVAANAYAKIFLPIAGAIGDATHLILSPDGELQLIPFESLVDPEGRYLVERYSTTYLTTGRDLLRLQVARPSKNKPLIVADPFFGAPADDGIAQAKATTAKTTTAAGSRDARRSVTVGQNLSAIYFAPLAGTAVEASSIKTLFPDATVLSGRQVTEAAIKRVEAPSILHIATHGFFLEDPEGAARDKTRSAMSQASMVPENPLLRSGLALSGANVHKSGDENGILTALQASGLNLWGTKLVTLSACDTGIGEVKDGEGVYGLRRAFFLAGTQSLVMSLWPVSDAVTREMMVDYYIGLKHGLGRGEALRQAELAMLKRKGRQHPFYWASFIESGEWANLEGKR